MKSTSISKNKSSRIASFIFSSGMFTGIVSMSFGLVSCGGGGEVSSTSSNAPTIAYMTAVSGIPGIIAAPAAQRLSIYGTNFVSGTAVTVNNNSTGYTVTSTAVVSSSEITTNVTIQTVPNDSYVTVTLQPPGGNSVSAILGVAHAYRTLAIDIQPILASNCVSCHDITGVFDMSTSQLSAINLIQTESLGCPQRFRVTAGDPRRASNVLIDLVKAQTTPAVLTCNANRAVSYRQMPPVGSPALSDADIVAMIDWIALGAN